MTLYGAWVLKIKEYQKVETTKMSTLTNELKTKKFRKSYLDIVVKNIFWENIIVLNTVIVSQRKVQSSSLWVFLKEKRKSLFSFFLKCDSIPTDLRGDIFRPSGQPLGVPGPHMVQRVFSISRIYMGVCDDWNTFKLWYHLGNICGSIIAWEGGMSVLSRWREVGNLLRSPQQHRYGWR